MKCNREEQRIRRKFKIFKGSKGQPLLWTLSHLSSLFLETVCFTFILCSGGMPRDSMSTVQLAQIENSVIFSNNKPLFVY